MNRADIFDTLIGKRFNSVVYLVYLVVVGFLGVHRWYQRKHVSGWLYFLTFGYCGVGIVIDMITVGLGRLQSADGMAVDMPISTRVVALVAAALFSVVIFFIGYIMIDIVVSNLR